MYTAICEGAEQMASGGHAGRRRRHEVRIGPLDIPCRAIARRGVDRFSELATASAAAHVPEMDADRLIGTAAPGLPAGASARLARVGRLRRWHGAFSTCSRAAIPDT